MAISRREALSLSGSTLAGLSLGGLVPARLKAQAQTPTQKPAEPWPDGHCFCTVRTGDTEVFATGA